MCSAFTVQYSICHFNLICHFKSILSQLQISYSSICRVLSRLASKENTRKEEKQRGHLFSIHMIGYCITNNNIYTYVYLVIQYILTK